jgi:hypothetical protein
MSSRSVAWVNNLSPDVDNASIALPRQHARLSPTLYVGYINPMSLLHLDIVVFGLAGLLVGRMRWIIPTDCHMLLLELVTCRAPIVSGIAPVISANILDQATPTTIESRALP